MRSCIRMIATYAFAVAVALQPGALTASPHLEAAPGAAGDPPTVGIDNFGQIDEGYYRGAQPELSDYADLAALGVRTVIDLQADGDNLDEEAHVRAAGMNFVRIPM